MRPSLQQVDVPPQAGAVENGQGATRGQSWLVRGAAGAGLVALVALAWALSRPGAKTAPVASSAPAGQSITVQPVRRAIFPRTLLVTGSIAAWDELPIGAETTGLRIERIAAQEGEHVRRGQLLAQLNDRPLQAQIRQVKADIARNRALIAQQQASYQEARAQEREAMNNRNRFEALVQEGAISSLEAEARRTTADTSQARTSAALQAIAVATSDLARAQAHLEELQAMLAQTRVVAPADGFISKRQAKLGSVVSPLAASALFMLVRDGRLELQAEVPEVHLTAIRTGQPVQVRTDAEPQKTYQARVREIAPAVDAQSRDAQVRIDLPASPRLHPGMFVRGLLQLGTAEALAVPEAAVLYKDARPFVFVVEGHKAVRREVITGERRDGQVEIRSGLVAGQPVVLSGAGYLKDGDPVRVIGGAS
ncbi:efflux RND transporter periplasmic adaptor subunit [Gloeobacter kilaueensis]|uniref:RND family efflux transporter MFP subunit n=1 Tax=Gloeobacter kilaueensis (strain ATCC BAA-2537 / CCAP 1431/1 / ULC 316 / JS1) TaxID=1183438 RepID=U5QG83_GLOK1|nr:efflux RND transporter periplasmic adaptor subunit [Gloeobacter kilaueensis]AGY56649.1 RND family efflux transporter MFP subunit [Gloeobacter kilaueensis JS1]